MSVTNPYYISTNLSQTSYPSGNQTQNPTQAWVKFNATSDPTFQSFRNYNQDIWVMLNSYDLDQLKSSPEYVFKVGSEIISPNSIPNASTIQVAVPTSSKSATTINPTSGSNFILTASINNYIGGLPISRNNIDQVPYNDPKFLGYCIHYHKLV